MEKEEILLALLPKYNPEPVFIFSREGELIFQNDASKSILPHIKSIKDINNTSLRELIYLNPDDLKHASCDFEDRNYSITFRNIAKLGIIMAYGFDVTQLKLAQKKTIKSMDETIDKYISLLSLDNEGHIIELSSAYCRLSGYSKAELLKQKFYENDAHDMNEKRYEEIWNHLNEDGIWMGEQKKINKDGETYWVRVKVDRGINENSQTEYLLIEEDITHEKIIQQQQQHILIQSRHAAMGEMIGMIAHQWRQPITSVSMSADNLLMDLELEDEVNKKVFETKLDFIVSQMQYLSQTIDDFRNFFHAEAKSEEVDVKDVIEATLIMIEKMYENSNISLKKSYDVIPIVSVQRSELMQVLLNILNNAKDAFNESNILFREVSISTYLKDDTFEIELSDTAGGIKEEFINKVFEPYFSTKKAKNGTGLGLYMSKMIIEEHMEGTLSLRNKKKGASFLISLPLK